MNSIALQPARKSRGQVVKLTLAHDSDAKDAESVVECLEYLLARARTGKIIGMSYTCIERDKEMFYSSAGYAHRNPAWAASMSSALLHGTMKRMFGDD